MVKVSEFVFCGASLSPQCTPTGPSRSLHGRAATKPFAGSRSICSKEEQHRKGRLGTTAHPRHRVMQTFSKPHFQKRKSPEKGLCICSPLTALIKTSVTPVTQLQVPGWKKTACKFKVSHAEVSPKPLQLRNLH